jgi:ribosomal protein L37E
MGKIGKGTGSFGKRRNKSHTLCRRYVSKRPRPSPSP